jgi:hypothetical protein
MPDRTKGENRMDTRGNSGDRVLSTERRSHDRQGAARTDPSGPIHGQLRSVALAKPNFEYQKRQKELEKKRKKEEKLKRRQERHAVPADGEAPATPPADDSDPA